VFFLLQLYVIDFFGRGERLYPAVFLFLLFYAPEDVIGHDKLLIGL